MFVLMSKKAAAKVPPPTAPAAQSSARTQNACDACRLRKSKCDGQVPCGRCKARHLVCTSSRRHPKASGPITEDHVATLQEQQRRLTRAISRMATVIKQAESQGFVGDGASTTDSELSTLEMADLLQRYAPDDATAEQSSSPANEIALPSKKRKFQATTHSDRDMDISMGDTPPVANDEKDYRAIEKFFATVQQHNNNNADPTTGVMPETAELQSFQPLPTSDSHSTSFPVPGGNSAFEFHPQMAPFVDLVDWDASLEHFLNGQYDNGSFGLEFPAGDFGVQDETS